MAENIPCYADVNNGYFDTVEVGIFLDLLRLIDNKRQDIPLVGVMRSPIFGFSMEDLITIRAESPEVPFYDAVMKYSDSNDGQLGQRLLAMIDQLDRWKKEARLYPWIHF